MVIVVAFTALCSFAIPNEAFATAFRLLKFGLILLSAWLGLFGYLLGLLALLIHLSGLYSFGVPYLMPFAASGVEDSAQWKDSIVRFPLFRLDRRPVYAKRSNRVRFRWKADQADKKGADHADGGDQK